MDSMWWTRPSPESKSNSVFLGYILILTGGIIGLVALGTDKFVYSEYTTTSGSNVIKDHYGVFSWSVDHTRGMYANTAITDYSISCYTNRPSVLADANGNEPSDDCTSECVSKKAFSFLAVICALLAVVISMDFRYGNKNTYYLYTSSPMIRSVAASLALLSAFSFAVVVGLFSSEVDRMTHLIGAGSNVAYSEKMGICAYGIDRLGSTTVASATNSTTGDSFAMMCACVGFTAIGSILLMVFYKHDLEQIY